MAADKLNPELILSRAEAFGWAQETMSDLLYGVLPEVSEEPGKLRDLRLDGTAQLRRPQGRSRKGAYVRTIIRQAELVSGFKVEERSYIPCEGRARRLTEALDLSGSAFCSRALFSVAQYLGHPSDSPDFGLRFDARQIKRGPGSFIVMPYSENRGDAEVQDNRTVIDFMEERGFFRTDALRGREYLESILLLDSCIQAAGLWDQLNQTTFGTDSSLK